MTDLEDLSAKAARLWLEFMQAQAKAAAATAASLPELTRSLAEAGGPLVAEVDRWMGGGSAGPDEPTQKPEPAQQDHARSTSSAPARPSPNYGEVHFLRPNHRRLIIRKSLSRRRARRA